LIPVDGFYEWKRTATSKQPYCFELNNGDLFVFAGLWNGWKDASGQWIKTCSILTTTPNAVTSVVHDRMPVILDPDSYDLWLDPGMNDRGTASELLKPYDARLMRRYPVKTRISHVANDGNARVPWSLRRLKVDFSPKPPNPQRALDERQMRSTALECP
jgi:putative SOS response-associated peptidase YedK